MRKNIKNLSNAYGAEWPCRDRTDRTLDVSGDYERTELEFCIGGQDVTLDKDDALSLAHSILHHFGIPE